MHRVPLSLRAVEILMGLQGLHDELVFPSPRDQVPLSDMVLTTFLRRVKAACHRTDLLDQLRPMMDTWAQFVSGNLQAE